MKKYGKYEKRPEGVPAPAPAPKQSKKMKSALLQTYITSLLCMVLCVTMFFGTSFAWFTSEVNNSGNEIYIGTLDVELAKKTGTDASTGNATWASLSATANGQNTEKLFDGNIRWEPGYTALETIKVVNEGDLAFKYVLNFIEEVPEGEASLADIAKFFDVWVYDHTANKDKQGVVENPSSYSVLTSDGSGWTNVGTLDKLLSGDAVLTGTMDKDAVRDTTVTDGTSQVKETEHTYTIALHMSEHATDEVKDDGTHSLMGKKITLNVKLIAYQKASEQDAFNNNYDMFTTVTTAEELGDALALGGNIVLLNDIKLKDEQITISAGTKAVLDLNGKVLSQESTVAAASCAISNKGELIITNGTITYVGVGDPNFGYGTNTINNSGKLIINDATIINTTASGSSVAIDCSAGAELIVNSGLIKSEKNAIRLCPFGSAAINCTINGGTITGARAIQIQLPSNKPEDAPVINLTVNGGTLSSNATDGMSIYSYSAGQSFANVTVTLNGGTFTHDVVFGGGNAKTTIEKVNVTGGIFEGKLGRYLANDGWEDINKP